jgi:hypothetical protein
MRKGRPCRASAPSLKARDEVRMPPFQAAIRSCFSPRGGFASGNLYDVLLAAIAKAGGQGSVRRTWPEFVEADAECAEESESPQALFR